MIIEIKYIVTVDLKLGSYRSVDMFSILKWCLHKNGYNSVKKHHF